MCLFRMVGYRKKCWIHVSQALATAQKATSDNIVRNHAEDVRIDSRRAAEANSRIALSIDEEIQGGQPGGL